MQRPSRIARNEGKCCDAVIRLLEATTGHQRANLAFPERKNHSAPVEMTFSLGKQLYALEHTKLEAYPEQNFEGLRFVDALETIESALQSELRPDVYFQLSVDATPLRNVAPRDHQSIRDALVTWVRTTVRTFDYSEFGRAHTTAVPPGVPFQVSLVAAKVTGSLGGQLRIARYAPTNLEAQRDTRVHDALARKLPKLKAWADQGARTVLALENDDIALSNVVLIKESVQRAGYARDQLPHTIFVMDVYLPRWNIWALKDGEIFPPRTRTGAIAWQEIDATMLVDITGGA